MPAVSTAIMAATAAVGIGTSLAGISEQKKQEKKAQQAAAQQNKAFGAQQKASVQASQASQRAEEARKQQMELDATRARRQSLRSTIVARSLATARGQGRGAQGDSAIQGAQFQIGNYGAQDQRSIEQNLGIGRNIFQANYDVLQANIAGANAGTQANLAGSMIQQAQFGIDWGKSLFSLGANIAGSAQQVGTIGSSLLSPTNSWTAGTTVTRS